MLRNPANPMTLPLACGLAAVAGALLFALAAIAWAGGDRVAGPAATCGTVVVEFAPEGSGGASNIKAKGVGCRKAKDLARSCIKGKEPKGWTAVTWTKTTITKGQKRVTYTPVGGGGCGDFRESCDDFGYRGVGFFNMQVAGPGCAKGRELAKGWYDAGGQCRFGSSCTVKRYRCRGNAKTGTVNCKRTDGYRVRWQMGE